MELVKIPEKESLVKLSRLARRYGVLKLLTVGGNTKIRKSDKGGKYLTAIMHFAPANVSGFNVCPKASPGCKSACLFSAGRGVFQNVYKSRVNRTKLFARNPNLFKRLLYAEIDSFIRKCDKKGVKPAIRLNGTSDIVWEKVLPDMFRCYPSVQFYDYTKIAKRFSPKWKLPKNYYLLFSRSEINDKDCRQVLKWGGNVAVVFNNAPKRYIGRKVINGDNTDLRFKDRKGLIVGLTAKGKAKKDTSGFVV